MKSTIMKTMSLVLALLVAGGSRAWAQNSELDQLKAAMQQMQKTMEEMQKKIAELEKEKRTRQRRRRPPSNKLRSLTRRWKRWLPERTSAPPARWDNGPRLNDQQEGAQRSKDSHARPEVPRLLSHSQHARADQIQRQAARGHNLGHAQLGQSRSLRHGSNPGRGPVRIRRQRTVQCECPRVAVERGCAGA